METGDFFGEIGILNLDGGINRQVVSSRQTTLNKDYESDFFKTF